MAARQFLLCVASFVGLGMVCAVENGLKPLHELDVHLESLVQSGPTLRLSDYFGKVLLITNVASECGYTENSYSQLNELQNRYASRGLSILGFPSNDFKQETGSAQEIYEFAKNKNVRFPLLAKTHVNGKDAHPLYKWLKGEYLKDSCDDKDDQCSGWANVGECENNPKYMLEHCKKSCTKCSETYPFGGPVKWNFNHFLVSRNGKVIAKWESAVNLLGSQQINLIENALSQDSLFLNSRKHLRVEAPLYIAIPFVLTTLLMLTYIIAAGTKPQGANCVPNNESSQKSVASEADQADAKKTE